MSDQTHGLPSEGASRVAVNLLNRSVRSSEGADSSRSDGLKFGLVIEGGAMRGVVSAGALIALEDLGMTKAFDCVYGTSAGAINGAYFLAKQARFGTTIYYEDINNTRFINKSRFRKIVDIDYLIDHVMREIKPLNVERVKQTATPMKIFVTNAADGAPCWFTQHESDLDLLTLLRASAAMPVLYDRSVTIRTQNFIDGGVAASIPINTAIDDGCTDILVLLTRKRGKLPSANGVLGRLMYTILKRRFGSRLAAKYAARPAEYAKSVDQIERLSGNDSPPRVLLVQPGSSEDEVSRTCTDRETLVHAASNSYRGCLRAFGMTRRFVYEGIVSDPI